MSNTVKPSKATTLALLQRLALGTKQHLPNGTITVGGVEYPAATLIGHIQSLIDAMTKQDAAKAAAKDALTALHDVRLQIDPLVQGYKEILVVMYAGLSQTLADFGLAPRKKRAPMTVEQKAAAKAKRDATRKARGTVGPKKRLSIKGTVAAPAEPPPAQPPQPKPAT
jgi:hypothetical protein